MPKVKPSKQQRKGENIPQGLYKDKPMKIMQNHGGAMWDTLFILCIKDFDKDFILDFCSRLPCKDCSDDIIAKLNNFNLENKTRAEILKFLWESRQKLHDKYNNKDFNNYLEFLGINCEKTI